MTSEVKSNCIGRVLYETRIIDTETPVQLGYQERLFDPHFVEVTEREDADILAIVQSSGFVTHASVIVKGSPEGVPLVRERAQAGSPVKTLPENVVRLRYASGIFRGTPRYFRLRQRPANPT